MSINVVNDKSEDKYLGCYGFRGNHSDLSDWLEDFINMSFVDEKETPSERWVACIWGQPGIGKTSYVNYLKSVPVDWNGKCYEGWDVIAVPAAQLEEMGDIHGLPEKCVYVKKEELGQWVSCEKDILQGWLSDGWEVDYKLGTKTMYSPPPFVPSVSRPTIILIDDANRASTRILKGMMQLFQTHRTVSWSLPLGCVIVLTGNPSFQDYMVADLDSAILSRMQHFTLTCDAKQWVIWATANKLDSRGISYISKYPEMLVGNELTNPRSLTKFFRFMKNSIFDINTESIRRMRMFAEGLLDKATVASMLTFFQRDLGLVIDPENILNGDDWIFERLKNLSKGIKNKKNGEIEIRIDIISVIAERLFAHVVTLDSPTREQVENFQKFVSSKYLEDDIRYNICMRLFRYGGKQNWLIGNKNLTDLIMDVL